MNAMPASFEQEGSEELIRGLVTGINPKTGNIVVILRVVVLLSFVEKRLEKKGKKG